MRQHLQNQPPAAALSLPAGAAATAAHRHQLHPQQQPERGEGRRGHHTGTGKEFFSQKLFTSRRLLVSASFSHAAASFLTLHFAEKMAASSVASKFIPLLDRVLVQKLAVPTKTKSGLFLPESAQKQSSAHMAKVLAVGKGRPSTKTGELIPPCVQVGQTVIVPEYGGMKVVIDEQEMQIYRSDDLIAVVNN